MGKEIILAFQTVKNIILDNLKAVSLLKVDHAILPGLNQSGGTVTVSRQRILAYVMMVSQLAHGLINR